MNLHPSRLFPAGFAVCILSLGTLACLSGCIQVNKESSHRSEARASGFDAVVKGISRQDLESKIGKPTGTRFNGASYWDLKFDEGGSLRLQVWYDRDDRVERFSLTSSGGKGGGFDLNYKSD